MLHTDRKVSVAWQIVFTFLPVIDFWGFYRIRKLRKYLLYVFVPSIVSAAYFWFYYSWGIVESRGAETLALPGRPPPDYYSLDQSTIIPMISLGVALQAFAIYLIIIWSRAHNRNFDTTTTNVEPPI